MNAIVVAECNWDTIPSNRLSRMNCAFRENASIRSLDEEKDIANVMEDREETTLILAGSLGEAMGISVWPDTETAGISGQRTEKCECTTGYRLDVSAFLEQTLSRETGEGC